MKTALITGVCGQDGSYLAEALVKKGYQIIGLDRRDKNNLAPYLTGLKDRLLFVQGEMTDPKIFETLIKRYAPQEIYNLAAVSSLKLAWENPVLTSEVNGLAPQRIFDAVRVHKPDCRVFQASSSEIFGKPTTSPQDEMTSLRPNNPYAVAKVFSEEMGRVYREKYKLFICCGILFNHESPRRPLNFVTAKIAYGAASAKLGIKNSKDLNEEGEPIVKDGKIALGNLDSQRDWSFAGDFVEAMHLMLQLPKPEGFVLGSGKLHTIADFAKTAFSHVGLDYKDFVTVDERFVRPVEKIPLVANPSKARKLLNWKETKTFEELVEEMVEEKLSQLS